MTSNQFKLHQRYMSKNLNPHCSTLVGSRNGLSVIYISWTLLYRYQQQWNCRRHKVCAFYLELLCLGKWAIPRFISKT